MRNIFKALMVTLILSIIQPISSFADWHGHDGDHHDHGRHDHSYVGVNLSLWPDNYYYEPDYYPNYYQPVQTVYVSSPVYQPVLYNGTPPVVMANRMTPGDTEDSFTINIPNDKGGYTAVTLKKSGNGYIGPQGEFYTTFPSVAQLKVMYGK